MSAEVRRVPGNPAGKAEATHEVRCPYGMPQHSPANLPQTAREQEILTIPHGMKEQFFANE